MIKVENLQIQFPVSPQPVIHQLSFELKLEKLALIGGSGSGKSLTAKALLGLVPKPGIVQADRLDVLGNNLLTMTTTAISKFRGSQIAMITQDPKTALNPVLKVETQIVEGFMLHQQFTLKQAKAAALDLLYEVQIVDPVSVLQQYPHQLSGGMGQRVLIATMLACAPKILIADEITSALDQELKLDIIKLLDKLHYSRNMAILMISHDLTLISTFCDRVITLVQGRLINAANY